MTLPPSPLPTGAPGGWQPIETAPKDGSVIIVMHEDVGSFPMAWNATATNSMFAPGEIGMWEMLDKSMTWRTGDGTGPSHWQPLTETGQS